MKNINPALSIVGLKEEAKIYVGIEYALLMLSVTPKDLEKSGHMKCLESSDDLYDYTIALGKVEGIAFHFMKYHSHPDTHFALYIDSDALENNKSKNFQPYVLAYRLLEQLEIPWEKVTWVNPELQSSVKTPLPFTY
jgi:hypothetical protein